MSKWTVAWLGVLSIGPTVLLIGTAVVEAYVRAASPSNAAFSQYADVILLSAGIAAVVMVVAFVLHAQTRAPVSRRARNLWTLALTAGSIFVVPLYWIVFFLYARPRVEAR